MIFKDLPIGAKKALVFYLAIDCYGNDFADVLDVSLNDEGMPNWDVLLPYAEKVLTGDYTFLYMDLEELKAYVMKNSPDLAQEYKSFDEYHKSYIKGETPYHENCDWPVIAYPSCGEALLDGWHRFHSYVRSGFNSIPVLLF